ncbi:hypothetical protein KR222_004354 [Zaprionus bogoriensis]|nr:hypothetical protein KR222_004354 [Zaprionus bogoriensis]
MDHNEISMCMDVKLDTHDKRAIALQYKTWTKCLVKIEAIKCVPCFLRLSFQSVQSDEEPQQQQSQLHSQQKLLSVSVNVPGVSLSLATSRTKQHSYGLFWTQNRRDCFIYFALDTETACRRHMKWLKKSIKNLELYRQVFLEQRRLSRDNSAQKLLGPLPNLPDSFCFELEANSFSLSARVSQIYEEIFDGSRISRASIASGIYEEMNLSSVCAAGKILEVPPALPPLPAHRKRINTFECQPGEIPRSSTNPESELAKKKKYKNMLDNIFGQKRRSGSASVGAEREREADEEQQQQQLVLYENAPTPETAPPRKRSSNMRDAHRNSFSSPDLSKLNFLDTFGEALSSEELNISLEDSLIEHNSRKVLLAQITRQLSKADSLESLNVSEQLPHNFNFSACNSSTINLIGANGAVAQAHPRSLQAKKKVLIDDLNGYCVMAPILPKTKAGSNAPLEKKPSASTASTSSGYSTGSYCSSTSSCNTDDQAAKILTEPAATVAATAQNESCIYEAMHGRSMEQNSILAEHLYENLLAVKASQELELAYGLSTSTPTESPLMPALPPKQHTPVADGGETQQPEEDYYQTPRKSIISVDDKIPSYYPNSCDTLKSKRRSPSNSAESAPGMRHLVSARLRRERKENLYISSPQQIIEQRQKSTSASPASASSSSSPTVVKTKTLSKKTAAHKISEGVYAVTHAAKRTSQGISNNNNNNNINELQLQPANAGEEQLLQLAMLQNIDFKFDDGQAPEPCSSSGSDIATKSKCAQLEDEYEHCYQAAERATRMLQKYATLAKFGNSPSKKQQQQLQLKAAMTQSVANTPSELQQQQQQQQQLAPSGNSLKKFASLPRFKKIDFSPLKLRLNNVLQRNATAAAPASPQ